MLLKRDLGWFSYTCQKSMSDIRRWLLTLNECSWQWSSLSWNSTHRSTTTDLLLSLTHKSLEMIHFKSLVTATTCLQRMLMKLQPYDLTLKNRPGNLTHCPHYHPGQHKTSFPYASKCITLPLVIKETSHYTCNRERPHNVHCVLPYSHGWLSRCSDIPKVA